MTTPGFGSTEYDGRISDRPLVILEEGEFPVRVLRLYLDDLRVAGFHRQHIRLEIHTGFRRRRPNWRRPALRRDIEDDRAFVRAARHFERKRPRFQRDETEGLLDTERVSRNRAVPRLTGMRRLQRFVVGNGPAVRSDVERENNLPVGFDRL